MRRKPAILACAALLALTPALLRAEESPAPEAPTEESAPAAEAEAPADAPAEAPDATEPEAEVSEEPTPEAGSEAEAAAAAEPVPDAGVEAEATKEAAPEQATEASPAPAAATLRLVEPVSTRSRPWTHELMAGLIAGALVLPTTAILSGAIGRGPGNLLAAALPAALLYLALPPLAVTFAAYGVGLFFDDDGIGWSPALWMALGVQVLGFALTALTGFNTQRANDLVAIAAIHTLALGATVTLTLPWGKP